MTLYYSEPICIEIQGRSVFVDKEVKDFKVRNFSEMNDVFMKKQTVQNDFPFYFMFQSITKKEGLRYDITIIPQKIIDEEYTKTYGHYHPIAEDSLSYPEIYQVLNGEALFMLQKKRADKSVDVIITYGKKGQTLIIPPNFGHVTINASKNNVLVLANLVANNFQPEYDEYKENNGAAYYITEDGLKQNGNYIIRTIERKKPEEVNARYGFECADLLKEFWENPGKFEFLKKPRMITRV